ncbi:MAG TPA: hypothetical protein VKR79_03455 [Gaiellaceae bacterium]|nr:hypothetical protein [Gaiellaceae bacterium]
MSKRLAAVLAAAAALVCTAAASADNGPTPLAPDDAAALIAAPGTSGLSATAAVDPATAFAAANADGADTSIASDFTVEQATGVSAATHASSSAPSPDVVFSKPACWGDQGWWSWGTWPYEQKIIDTTYWCAVYGVKITLRTSSVTTDGDICGVNWRAGQLIGGGVGFASFTERSSAGFACPTVVPWITLHPSHHLDIRRDDRGGAAIVGTG